MFKAYRSLAEVPADFGPCALTIGNFDGVHLGHRRILETAIERARSEGWKSAVLTFDPHPLEVVAPERAPQLMTSIGQRLEKLEGLGIDQAVVAPFTPEFSRYSPERFVEEVLVRLLGARWIVVGRNFRFGRRHAGDVGTLENLGAQLGFRVEAVPPVSLGGEAVSSTRIRRAVREGRLGPARRLLGAPFTLEGEVAAGRGIGSRDTVPTLNLEPHVRLLPADGVYVSETRGLDGGRCWRSISNVGVRPTFGGGERTVETHLLDAFDGPPPRRLAISFYRRLRDERRFDSAPALRAQILRDIERAQRFFRLRDAVRALLARTA